MMAAAKSVEFLDQWLERYLVEGGVLEASALTTLQPGTHDRLWNAAVAAGLTTDGAIVALLTTRFRVGTADLRAADGRVSTLIPAAVARKHLILPLSATDRSIDIATADPRDLAVEQELEWVTGRAIQFRIASPRDILARLDELYQPENVINRLLRGLAATPKVEITGPVESVAARTPALEAPMSRLVDAIISDAVFAGASDIHSEVEGNDVVIRYRVDGILREIMRLPETAGSAFVRRVKIVSGLDVTNSMTPQDGRSTARVGEESVDLRVATAPVARHGEKLVIRILSKQNLKGSIPDLGLAANEEAVLRRMIGHREGMVLVTGPTGSGKTTTLYAILNHLRTGKVNIVTVEDPVEYDVDGISQMQVNEAQGFTFATALRSVLRQDPDIVLVGEIRDLETATIAMQAGLTGHLVFSTLHTNDAASAIVRLRDMEVEAFKIGSTLRGVVAQRLVRRLCDACATALPLGQLPAELQPTGPDATAATPRQPVGCKQCGGSGYKGRAAVMEFLPIEGEVPRLIETGAPLADLLRAARQHGMQSLWEGGLVRVWTGVTSAEELQRVLGDRPEDAYHAEVPAPSPGDADPASSPPQALATTRPVRKRPKQTAAGTTAKGKATTKATTTSSGKSRTKAKRTTKQPAPTRARTRTAPVAAAPVPPPEHRAEDTTILIADDDASMRRLLGTVLGREGFQIREAVDGLEALDAVESGSVDLVVLDHDMPNLTGLGVLEELRARILTTALPVIMLTARTDDTELEALELGAQDFLTKPVQPRSLVARVKAVLRRSQLS
ncbi:MAG TPA: ATPase, T2SS/T4P/T4SS family [Gemmatimonadales bacterium]|nr:ATPase, T2SS/T4P/T4SS family [Gemmatimonadales bacterium]